MGSYSTSEFIEVSRQSSSSILYINDILFAGASKAAKRAGHERLAEVDPERETAGTGWLVMDRTGKVNT